MMEHPKQYLTDFAVSNNPYPVTGRAILRLEKVIADPQMSASDREEASARLNRYELALQKCGLPRDFIIKTALDENDTIKQE